MSVAKRIILVEDDFTYLSLMSEYLTQAGYKVAAYTHGMIGLESYQREAADLVITDIFLPDIDGVDLIRGILHHNPDAKIISMSAQCATANIDHLGITLKMGCLHALTKPVNFPDLVKLIEESLQQKAISP